MSNNELATKIIDQYATAPVEATRQTQAEIKREANPEIGSVAKDLEEKTENFFYTTLVGVVGITHAFEGPTAADARQAAIDYLTHELDTGNIVLSETWENDHLN